MIFDILMQVALFIINFTAEDVDRRSIEFDANLAGLFASAIVTVILTIIYNIPIIGDLIYAVSVINFILEIVCAAKGKDFEESEKGLWICGGISGILANALGWVIFSAMPILDVKYEDGLQAGERSTGKH